MRKYITQAVLFVILPLYSLAMTTQADRLAERLRIDAPVLQNTLEGILAKLRSKNLSDRIVLPPPLHGSMQSIARITPYLMSRQVYVDVVFKSYADFPAQHPLLASQRIRYVLLSTSQKPFHINTSQQPGRFVCHSITPVHFAVVDLDLYRLKLAPLLPSPFNLCRN